MSLKKKMVSMGTAMVVAVSMMRVSASAYNLHYDAGAGSTVNVTEQSVRIETSGSDRITVTSTYFTTYISGAYCEAYGITYLTTTANINSVGTYYLVYKGTSAPKAGLNASVKVQLVDYNASRSVSAIGTMKG